MRSKFAIVMVAALVSGLAWSWFARESPRIPSEADRAARVAEERHERRTDSTRDLSPPKAAPPTPSGERTPREPRVARSPSTSRANELVLERRLPARRAPAVAAEDRGGAVDDHEVEPGSEEVARIRQLLKALRGDSRETPGDALDAAELSPEDVDRLDLDGNREIDPWEQEQVQRLLERAELHPRSNDRGDGAYPVDREDYGREKWEFDAVDTNQDSLMDLDEYHAFLVETERVSVFFDTDGDRKISFDESGFSADDFAPLDRDDSGDLKGWEIRRAVAQGALD
jgi:hypothetical protein